MDAVFNINIIINHAFCLCPAAFHNAIAFQTAVQIPRTINIVKIVVDMPNILSPLRAILEGFI